jgi:hypothetical protein
MIHWNVIVSLTSVMVAYSGESDLKPVLFSDIALLKCILLLVMYHVTHIAA